VFGLSFSELVIIGVVTLVAVGPTRLPGMLRTLGQWMRKLRKMTTEVRQQTGIDEILRAEGIQGGLNELRGLVRGGHAPVAQPVYRPANEPYANLDFDVNQEYPPEGSDAGGALPDDLLAEPEPEPEPEPPPPPVEATTSPAAVKPIEGTVAQGEVGPPPPASNGANPVAPPASPSSPTAETSAGSAPTEAGAPPRTP
jgi:sec-independent protein translocase protein TatB